MHKCKSKITCILPNKQCLYTYSVETRGNLVFIHRAREEERGFESDGYHRRIAHYRPTTVNLIIAPCPFYQN